MSHFTLIPFLTKDRGRAANEWGAYLLEKDDFDRFTSLPNHWYYYLNQHGEGRAVNFPIKVRPFLSKSSAKDFVVGDNGTLNRAPILYNEKLSAYFVKRACNTSKYKISLIYIYNIYNFKFNTNILVSNISRIKE